MRELHYFTEIGRKLERSKFTGDYTWEFLIKMLQRRLEASESNDDNEHDYP